MRVVLAMLIFVVAVPATAGPAWSKKRTAAKVAAQKNKEAEAFRLFQEARKDFLERRFKEAVDKLARAYALFPQPMIRFRHAEALENLRKVELALELYKQIANVRDPKLRGPIRSAIRRLEALLEQPVEVSIISGEVTGALIFVDGKPYGTTPTLIKLARGNHELKVTKEGHEPFVVSEFEAKGIDTIKIDASLKPFKGMVRVRVPTGNFTNTRVLIDGRLVPIADAMATETTSISVPVGRHQLECSRLSLPTYYRPFVVKAGALLNLSCMFAGQSEAGSDINWVGVGVMVGGGLTMIGGGALLGSYFADVALAEELGKDLKSSKHIAGGILLGVGVAALVTGAVLYATHDSGAGDGEVDGVSLRAAPLVSPRGAGFSLSGDF